MRPSKVLTIAKSQESRNYRAGARNTVRAGQSSHKKGAPGSHFIRKNLAKVARFKLHMSRVTS